MKSSTKFWLGFFTFLPLLFLIVFFGLFFVFFLENIVELDNSHGEFPVEFLYTFFWFFALIIVMAIVSLGIKIYYIVHTNNNAANDTNKKIMWTLLLIFAGLVASIVYYFIEIIPLKSTE
jgi:ABC-type bacteriocin/lantibiotic exporter with double-glycine peptidase domain